MLNSMITVNSERARLLEEIAKEIANCRKCRLWSSRTKPVPGRGNINADVILIGEAPGYNEDLEGEPFVGAAGKLLDQLLDIARLKRKEVFITNVLKCRPPNNRDPLPDEIEACGQYLDRQVAAIRPKIVVCLGRHSTSYVLLKGGIKVHFGGSAVSISAVRGQLFKLSFEGLNLLVIPTYHPAAGLYNPKLKKELLSDFDFIGRIVEKVREGLLTI
ncbi:MAG: type-4 uracil-DNA glycosylase [Candidatus Nezhaarchaeales archaeon]